LRLRIPAAVWLAVSGVALLAAQAVPPSPNPPSAAVPKPRSQAKPTRPSAPSALQAIFDATSLGSPLLLDKDWRVGITSDPAAASPAFNDSSWAIRTAQASMDEVPDEDQTQPASAAKPTAGASEAQAPKSAAQRYAWFRIHIKLAPNHGPVSLLIELPVSRNSGLAIEGLESSPEVFANGKQIQPEGPHGDAPEDFQPISRIYNLNLDPSETSLTLAVRTIYVPFGLRAYTAFFGDHTLELGAPDDLQRELNLWSNRGLFERLPSLIYSVLLAVVAVFLFALYFAQKGHTEYLWLALHELVQAPSGFIEQAGNSARMDSLWCMAIVLQLAVIAAYFFFEFLVAFLSLPRRWYVRALRYTAPVLAAAGTAILLFFHGSYVLFALGIGLCAMLWLLACGFFVFATLIRAALRSNFEAGLFLVPLLIILIGAIEPAIAAAIGGENGESLSSRFTFQAGPIPLRLGSIGDYASILVIVLIIFFRFLRIHRDQERASNELAAARGIQELLIPREKPATPGFEVDSVYSPAQEVGGDFFYVQTVGLDGIVVVIGDVAGHGLKAAMNVSLIMGALRRTEDRSPARILEALNGVLAGADSFTTCQAVWFAANGEMVIANAGHLPPYLNTQEITLPGSLPLGVLIENSYEESRFYLHPGDRVLLLSDGVVEARHPNGELFGFDRVRYMSQQPAASLADAAKSFGQQDDITVLTVRRQAEVRAA